MEAREVLQRQGWGEITNLHQADGILVVCRSGLNYQLDSSYGSIKELDNDVYSQLNISCPNFHIYRNSSDMRVEEVKHVYYPANE